MENEKNMEGNNLTESEIVTAGLGHDMLMTLSTYGVAIFAYYAFRFWLDGQR